MLLRPSGRPEIVVPRTYVRRVARISGQSFFEGRLIDRMVDRPRDLPRLPVEWLSKEQIAEEL
jgi:hypothetical protein